MTKENQAQPTGAEQRMKTYRNFLRDVGATKAQFFYAPSLEGQTNIEREQGSMNTHSPCIAHTRGFVDIDTAPDSIPMTPTGAEFYVPVGKTAFIYRMHNLGVVNSLCTAGGEYRFPEKFKEIGASIEFCKEDFLEAERIVAAAAKKLGLDFIETIYSPDRFQNMKPIGR